MKRYGIPLTAALTSAVAFSASGQTAYAVIGAVCLGWTLFIFLMPDDPR